MKRVNRRRFVQLGAAGGAAFAGPALWAQSGYGALAQQPARDADPATDRTIRLSGDGLTLSPSQYAHLLARLADERGIALDNYILGGVVEELEANFAKLLGKEM